MTQLEDGGQAAVHGASAMATFAAWCAQRGAPVRPEGTDYASLWRWSVDSPADFWSAIAEFFEVPMGGTASAVVSGELPDAAPLLPVRPGELPGPCLGVALDAWDPEGRPVRERTGELVITKPMPSMPLYFWDDPGDRRYHAACFSTYPVLWRHGDWITVTASGPIVVSGRSDSTLNRGGVRMGSAEVYQEVENLPEVAESLVIGAEQPDGGYWMPLFVKLVDGRALTDRLVEEIRSAIRDGASPRHVPDDVIAVDAIPHTVTGKNLEVPVKRILQGVDIAQAADPSAVDDPTLLEVFARYRLARTDSNPHTTRGERGTLMTTETDTDVLDRMMHAVEQGDLVALRGCFTPDALVWHNDDEAEQDVDTFTAVLANLCAVSTRRSYEDRRRTVVGRLAFLQHVLTADLLSGATFRLPAMMRVSIEDDGRISRIEEYYDTAPLAVLATAAG